MNTKTRISRARIRKRQKTGSFAATAWLALLLVASGNSFASSSAWWMLCNGCTADSDFERVAVNAPGTHTPIYVTSWDSNETRKYDRRFVTEELVRGIERTVLATDAELSGAVMAVFEKAINDAAIHHLRMPRNDLAGILPGVEEQDSVIGDISRGYISSGLKNAIREEIDRRILLPTYASVNAEAALDTPIAGMNFGQRDAIRIRDLVIVITYDDGSTLMLARRRRDGKFVNWSITDAEENIISLQGPDEAGNTLIRPESFVNRELVFGPGSGSAARALAEDLAAEAALYCDAWSTSTRDTVKCQRR